MYACIYNTFVCASVLLLQVSGDTYNVYPDVGIRVTDSANPSLNSPAMYTCVVGFPFDI